MDGDRVAFGQLFKKYYPILFQYGQKICTDTNLLEDAIQELFIEIWSRRPVNSPDSVAAYLFKAVKFKLYKSFGRRKFPDVTGNTEEGIFELSHESLLISRENDEQTRNRLITALNGLSPRQQEVIYLKIYKGLSYEEISDIMNIRYQVVRNLLYQALKSLRALFRPLIVAGLGLLHSSL